MDEAIETPFLCLVTAGFYGADLPNQNERAPLRLMTPGKYGLQGDQSIVTIRFAVAENCPSTPARLQTPREYGSSPT